MTTATEKKLDELYDLISDIEIAMMTTRRPDGELVTRPMATQEPSDIGDLWFVTSIDTHKVDELESDPHVSLGYYDHGSHEWVSVSGTVRITQDRDLIHRLYKRDWKMWFEDEGGERDGGPDDPRLALMIIDAHSAVYMKAKHSKPVQLFRMAHGLVTGENPELGRTEQVTSDEFHA